VTRGLTIALAALALAAPAQAGGPAMLIGAAEDDVKQANVVSARARLDLLRLAGMDTVRVTVIWAPGETEPSAPEGIRLAALEGAAELTGMRVIVSVYHFGSRTTPLTDEARGEFAEFAASIARSHPALGEFIVGNEPNLNRFWLPQFNPDGSNAAAPAYLQLLARTYDALKAVSPGIRVIGGAVSPRGIDRPGTARDTHSPTKFILDLGAAYRASGRTLPIMDEFAFHPYGDNSSQSPLQSAHPNTTSIGLADYPKLGALLGQAFDGTGQPGSGLPILYDEFGVEAVVPPEKASLYSGTEPPTTRPVDEATQALYYRQAMELAFCQPNVRGLLLFHAFDETPLDRWQSGLYYADGSAKTSLARVAAAVRDVRRGIVARCENLALTPKAVRFLTPSRPLRPGSRVNFRLACDLDCTFAARLERLPQRTSVLAKRGTIRGGRLTSVSLRERRLAPGRYRIVLELTAPVNPGPPGRVVSKAFWVKENARGVE
jgi:hypothetical protein